MKYSTKVVMMMLLIIKMMDGWMDGWMKIIYVNDDHGKMLPSYLIY
jgi:hypothetical protein